MAFFHSSSRSKLSAAAASQEGETQLKQCTNPACEAKPSLPLTALSCPSCSSLQPLPSDIDYYAVLLDPSSSSSSSSSSSAPSLSLSQRWRVSPADLKSSWRKKMALTHPDRMGGKSEREQAIAEQQSSLINKAYETLRKPLSRAVYLLERFAGSSVSEADSLDDPSLLMQVMELREQLEDAADEQSVASVREENAEQLERTVQAIDALFDAAGDDDAQQRMDWDRLKKLTVELRYWTNIDDVCREWQPGKQITLQH